MNQEAILVAEGAGCIGAKISIRLAQTRASTVAADLDTASAAAVAEPIMAGGGRAVGISFDSTKQREWAAAAQAAVSHVGGLTGVANCVGVSRPQDSPNSVAGCSPFVRRRPAPFSVERRRTGRPTSRRTWCFFVAKGQA